jgi:hypothetical protein
MHLITQKIANKFKKSQKLNMTLDMLCISSKKLVVVKLKFKFSNVSNLVTLAQIL